METRYGPAVQGRGGETAKEVADDFRKLAQLKQELRDLELDVALARKLAELEAKVRRSQELTDKQYSLLAFDPQKGLNSGLPPSEQEELERLASEIRTLRIEVDKLEQACRERTRYTFG